MESHIDTLLLLALPASGKSELRRYLASVDDRTAIRDFGLGPTVQLDDYPYVHLMRRTSHEIQQLGHAPTFFPAHDQGFVEGADWATLIVLVNEDYAALGTRPPVPEEPTTWLLDRFDRAREVVGLEPPFAQLPQSDRNALATVLDAEVAEMAQELSDTLATYEPGVSTVLIEFARGGPDGTEPPLPPPHGYAFSLRYLSRDILASASALYVWVTPEESRRRNLDRAIPGLEGDASILHHGVPISVMLGDYGTDDFLWLMEQGGGTAIEVRVDDTAYVIPAAVFDNRVDHTSFLRVDQDDWDRAKVADLHAALAGSFAGLKPTSS